MKELLIKKHTIQKQSILILEQYVDKDHYFMRKAISLARRGIGRTAPNPSVGCIIVKNGKIISKSRTEDGGRPHAEQNILDYISSDKIVGGTLYTTLEPCCNITSGHISCTEKIIQSGVKRVVIGTYDPNPRINGRSILKLKKNNIDVVYGILEDECREIISGFRKRILYNLPYITMKIATSLDGKIALRNNESKWITSEYLRKLGHRLRSKNDGILTGIGTVLSDDPLLTCRMNDKTYHKPTRIILDTYLRIPQSSKIITTSNQIETIIFTNKKGLTNYFGAKVVYVNKLNGELELIEIIRYISDMGINNLLIEAGKKINTSFIKSKLVDKIVLYQSKKIIGEDGVNAIGELGINSLSTCYEFQTEFISER